MSVIDAAKDLANLARAYDKLDLYQQAVDLMRQATELAQENFELKQKIAELERLEDLKTRVTYDAPSHSYQLDGKGAYCPTCFDQHRALQRLFASHRVGGNRPNEAAVQWVCHRCKFVTRDWVYISRDKIDFWPHEGQQKDD